MYKQLPLNELLEKLEVFVTYNISKKSGGCGLIIRQCIFKKEAR